MSSFSAVLLGISLASVPAMFWFMIRFLIVQRARREESYTAAKVYKRIESLEEVLSEAAGMGGVWEVEELPGSRYILRQPYVPSDPTPAVPEPEGTLLSRGGQW